MLIMRKMILFCLGCLLTARLLPAASAESRDLPAVGANAAIVINSGGEVVFEKNADTRSLIASTTKLMTALLALEANALTEEVTIRPEWTAVEGSSMYLQPGERYTLRELLEGLLLASGNDAALALACHTSGDEATFVAAMNARARELGMRGTHFANPHGLDAPEHYSTARDLALLMAACMARPDFAALTAETSCTVKDRTYVNHNKLLTLCPGCIGGKTGYTEAAGRCLVSCCEREGTRLICVTLHDPDDWQDHQLLYHWAFGAYSTRTLGGKLDLYVPVLSGTRTLLPVETGAHKLFLPRAAELRLVVHLPRFVFAPVEAGESAGRIQVFWDGEQIDEWDLRYAEGAALAVRERKR